MIQVPNFIAFWERKRDEQQSRYIWLIILGGGKRLMISVERFMKDRVDQFLVSVWINLVRASTAEEYDIWNYKIGIILD